MVSLVVGGTRGIGRSIVETLKIRDDQVYTLSRRESGDKNHISINLELKTSVKKIEDASATSTN